MERNKKFTSADINKVIKKEEFTPFTQMISGLLKEAIDRLEGSRLTNLNKEAILPLRDLADHINKQT